MHTRFLSGKNIIVDILREYNYITLLLLTTEKNATCKTSQIFTKLVKHKFSNIYTTNGNILLLILFNTNLKLNLIVCGYTCYISGT